MLESHFLYLLYLLEDLTYFSLREVKSNGYQALFPPGVRQPAREGDHSSPSNAEVKDAWRCTSTPPIRLHGVVLS